MINFLYSNLKPKIKYSSVCDDYYPPENLISDDDEKLQLGFMGYHITKPPVDLIFNLKYNINLFYIKIWTTIGSLKTTEIDLYLKNNINNDFIKLTKCEILTNHDGVIFYRSDFISKETLSKQTNINNFSIQPFFINSKTRKLCKETSCIKVSIKKALKYVPVLKKIEIWGKPAKTVPKEVKHEIDKLWRNSSRIENKCRITDEKDKLESNDKEEKLINLDLNDSTLIIPDEYLDGLTYHIMSLPMVLPSGNIIDLTTLEKHNHIEECWGRLPSDPFTGQLYTEKRKPMLDTALKANIDRFLLKYSDNIYVKNTPRTVGVKRKTSSNDLSLPSKHYDLAHKNNLLETNYATLSKPSSTITSGSLSTISTTSTIATLDSAIENALKNVTRYSYKNKQSINFYLNDEILCFKCKFKENLYQIRTCKHLICRTCLIKLDTNSVCVCGIHFNKNNVLKFHK